MSKNKKPNTPSPVEENVFNEYHNDSGVLYLKDGQKIAPLEDFICREADLTSSMRKSVTLLNRNVEVEIVEEEDEKPAPPTPKIED
jgi:hypothetical protein